MKELRVEHYVTCTDAFCFYMKVPVFKTMLFLFFKTMKNEIKILVSDFTIYLCKQKTGFFIIRSRKSDDYSL